MEFNLRMPERTTGQPPARTESTVHGADWYAKELAGETHERVLFTDLDLTEAKLQGMVFNECVFRRAQFNCSVHRDGAFVNCTFQNCSFFETSFAECKLLGSTFERCTYDLMRVTGGNWAHVALAGADLRKVTFEGARLREADLTGARCQGAVLRECDLTSAWLAGAVLTECDLRGSELAGIEPESVSLRGAIITIAQAVTIVEALGLDVRSDQDE